MTVLKKGGNYKMRMIQNKFLPGDMDNLFRLGGRGDLGSNRRNLVFTWANAITTMRLAGLLLFLYLMVHNLLLTAFWTLWIMALLDVTDGYVARRLDQVSRLGSILDPVVDHLTMLTVTFVLVIVGRLPIWIAALIGLREFLVAMTMAGLVARRMPLHVTRISKIATLALFFGLPVFLLRRADWNVLQAVAAALLTIGLLLYPVSAIQYVRRFLMSHHPTHNGADENAH